MKILLSNDDGIHAEGLKILWQLLKENNHEIQIVAPHRQHSGASHAITLSTPLLIHKIHHNGSFFGIAVDGSPSDAVKLGISNLYPDVEMVVSGINLGPNVGPSIYYSGTVAAAFEGAVVGKIALAFSFESFDEEALHKVEHLLRPFFPQLLKICRLPILYNINIPDTSSIQGIKITRQFRGYFMDQYEKRINPLGREYYWLKDITFSAEEESTHITGYPSDIMAMKHGYISVTPLQFDLTNYGQLPKLEQSMHS